MCGLGSSLYCYILRKNSVLWITVPSSNQVHKWVLANLMLGVTLRNSTPYSGGGEKKHCFVLWKTECHPEEPFGLNVNWDCACPDLSALLTLIVQHIWDQIHVPLCNLCSSCSWSVMYWLSERRSVMYSLDGTKTHSDSVSLVQNTGEPLINGHSWKWDIGHLPGHLVGVGVIWIFFKILLFLCENGIMLRQS